MQGLFLQTLGGQRGQLPTGPHGVCGILCCGSLATGRRLHCLHQDSVSSRATRALGVTSTSSVGRHPRSTKSPFSARIWSSDRAKACSEARGPARSHAHPRAVPQDPEAIGSKAWLRAPRTGVPGPTQPAACVPGQLCHRAHCPICKMGQCPPTLGRPTDSRQHAWCTPRSR